MAASTFPTLRETLDALRQVLWAYASASGRMFHTGRNPEPGLALLGLTAPAGEFMWLDMPAGWDISGYPVTATLSTIHSYAADGYWSPSDNWADLATDILMFMDGLRNFYLLDATTLPWEASLALCWRVLDVGYARHRLDDGQPLTLAQVAQLANMDEKSVRNAANPKSKDPLITFSEGSRTFVSADQATAWLSRRRGYKPTTLVQSKAEPEVLRVAAFPTPESFALFVSGRCEQLGIDLEGVANEPASMLERLEALVSGDLRQDLPFLYETAVGLKLEPESFIRAFVELSLKNLPAQLQRR